ncbi:16S rRNA (guanine(966)-N(2))-methyltransferase RsmD, partial [bacterium]|nr:16S rRNA (guanine(966)-N(2))-methyltransferase RsmD [bacterium]
MRVNAGKWKGRSLSVPKGTRPTTDRVKEALFSILGSMQGLSILDLYAGSGSLGIEALSRGAVSVAFVETSRQALRILAGNLPEPDEPAIEFIQQDVFEFLNQTIHSFDIIFCDPPYNK